MSMLIKARTNLTLLSSIIKLQQTNSYPRLKPALHLCTGELSVRFAGHSKWQNIKHTKAAKDLAKCRTFAKIIREMEKAVLKGPFDPKLNSQLSKVLEQARSVNMPSSTINRALERFKNKGKNTVFQFFSYRGPNGIYVLVTVQSFDKRKTIYELNKISRKHRFTLYEGDPLSLFEGKGWIYAKSPYDKTNLADKSLEDAIEVGAEEVEPDEEEPEVLRFICELSELAKVRSKLESRNYTIDECTEMFLPRAPVEIPEEQMGAINTLIEEYEELPEVEKVYLNVV